MTLMSNSDNLFSEYKSLINNEALFASALSNLVHERAQKADTVSLHGLLQLLDVVVDMLADSGLLHLQSVYKAVKRHASVHFQSNLLWQTCHLSGINARECIAISDSIYVHKQYTKWVCCLWLCTHVRDVERGQESIPAAHFSIFRAAFCCVLKELQEAYVHVGQHLKKNKVFACTSQKPCA